MRSGAGYKLARQAAFVELTTDEGISGYGPCSFGSASLDLGSVASLCDDTFAAGAGRRGPAPDRAPLGQDLLRRRSCATHGPRCVGVAILSAIDIALWDIKGKALGVPGLPAARRRRSATACRCTRAPSTGRRPSRPCGAGAGVPRPGLQGLQGQGRPRRRRTTSRRCTRSATTVGYDVDMLVDANQCYTRHLALQVGRELEKLDVLLLRGAAADRRRRRPRVPGGQARRPDRDRREHVHALGLPAVLSEAGAIHVVQADASRCGGISEAQADRRPRRRLPPARDPAHVLGRADDRREPPRRRGLVERADHRVRPHVQPDPGGARHEPARRCTTA